METKQLYNSTTLSWRANSEPDLAGYQILWRETTTPLWQRSIPTGNVTQFNLPNVSKDTYLCGLCAFDRDGNASPAVTRRQR